MPTSRLRHSTPRAQTGGKVLMYATHQRKFLRAREMPGKTHFFGTALEGVHRGEKVARGGRMPRGAAFEHV
jgi:hypothetical protein